MRLLRGRRRAVGGADRLNVRQHSMDSLERHSLAERELRAGLIDLELKNLAIREAKGIGALARQIYLERRVKSMKDEANRIAPNDPGIYFRDIEIQVEIAERKIVRRNKWEGWIWVMLCFGSVTTSTLFLFLAGSASTYGDARIIRYTLLAIIFMILGIVSFIRTKRVEQRELISLG
jgi:hypothetical protein